MRFAARWFVVVVGLHAGAPAALAQTPAELPGDAAAWLSWLVGAGIAVVILLPAFLNPKRSHLT